MVESELFGHVKGAFTGAMKDRLGARRAHGGTLFLDEIGDMALTSQTRLLRFIQEGIFQKVGGDKDEKVDIRFICATHHDLWADVETGQFRKDLFYRINIIPIILPPLHERRDDILLLAQTFLKKYANKEQKAFKSFTKEAEDFLLHYEWPGNVRQLEGVIFNTVLLNDGLMVTKKMLLKNLEQLLNLPSNTRSSQSPNQTPPKILTLKQAEKQAIETAIEFCEGNIEQAAKLLEVNKSTLYRKLQYWQITYKRTISSRNMY